MMKKSIGGTVGVVAPAPAEIHLWDQDMVFAPKRCLSLCIDHKYAIPIKMIQINKVDK